MTIPQITAAIIIIGALIYFFYDVIRHAKAKGGSTKQIILRAFLWILIFCVVVAIDVWLNRNWPDKWFIIKIDFSIVR